MMCCSVEMVFLHEVPRLSRMVVFCITFIAYLQPQSRLVTSMTCPNPPWPSTRSTWKSSSSGIFPSWRVEGGGGQTGG